MAFKKIKNHDYIADTKKDLRAIETVEMGARCYVIKEAGLYEQLSTGEWIRQAGSNYSNHLEFDPYAGITTSSGEGENVDLTGYATEDYVNQKVDEIDLSKYAEATEVERQIAAIEIPSIEDLAKKEQVEKIANNPILKAFDVERYLLHTDGQAIYLTADDSTTLVEVLQDKGLGLYNIWMGKGRSDLPKTMIADNTSGRGFACIDFQSKADPTNFIGYVILFDKNNSMYYRFISHGEAGPWMKVNAVEE